MGGCSAANCSNHSRKGFRMFRFPSDKERRKKWAINCRRMDWEPTIQAQICIAHFEESQFEMNRKDGKHKLKKSAIPTIFNVPNPPPSLTDKRKKGFGCPKSNSILDKKKHVDQENIATSADELYKRIEALEKENKLLRDENKEKYLRLASFLSDEQINNLAMKKRSISNWTEEAIIKGLKLRFALGKHGFNYLRKTGYPAPSYSTLNRRIQCIQINYGVMHVLFSLLKAKVETMDKQDKNCCVLVDEMEIACHLDFDTSSKSFIGNVTLGETGVAKHYVVVMLRGLSSTWKQTVVHELTGPSTSGPDMKDLITKSIEAARAIGLKVRASTSDMASTNQAMWGSLGVGVTRKKRQTSYKIGISDDMVHSIADVPHLLKNMRTAFLFRMLILPESLCQEQCLPSTNISSGYVKELWISELNSESALRSLQHLKKIHLFPNHFSKMNVAHAVQLFSIKTAAALEKAVALQQIQKAALTTAWWIRMMAEWFELTTARHPKCALTIKNKETKYDFLYSFVEIMQTIKLGKGWKPLQTGMIMSTLSIVNLSKELFSEGFKFFLPGRLTQDALENVFSQIRSKSGTKPTALQAKQALRLICVSQFISDIGNSNYASDSDFHLLKKISVDKKLHDSVLNEQPTPSTSSSVNNSVKIAAEENDIYFIAGVTLRAVSNQKNICKKCIDSLTNCEDNSEPVVPHYRALLTEFCDRGGLLRPKSGIYRICREAERVLQNNKDKLLSSQISITENFIQSIKNNCSNVILPTCCNVLEAVANYYLVVRCKGFKNYLIEKRAYDISFGSASVNKKQQKE